MGEHRFRRVRDLFEKTRDLSEAEASVLLDGECADDASMREDVLRLIEQYRTGQNTNDLRPGEALASDSTDPVATEDPAASESMARLRARLSSGKSRYTLHGEVARGGMGAILRVRDEDLGRQLAMKVILGRGDDSREGTPTPAVDADIIERFLDEAQVTGQLDHPGVVPVHELGLDESGRVYFTMRLVKGQTAREAFLMTYRGEQDWTLTRALEVVLRVCDTLAYAHDKGVIHRDLKPSNIMVGRFGEVYVMDWGLAKVLGREDKRDTRIRPPSSMSLSNVKTTRSMAAADSDSPLLTMDGDVVGTPSYMSPEQAEGRVQELGPRTDVYAVGAMLYFLLTGQQPYIKPDARVSPYTVLAAVLNGPPTQIGTLAPKAPAELVAIAEKAMARQLQERYADMTTFAGDIRAFLDGKVVRAYRTGAWVELRKWMARNRALAATAALAVVLLVVGLVVAMSLRSVAEARAQLLEDRAVVKYELLLRRARAQVAAFGPAWPEQVAEMRQWLEVIARDLTPRVSEVRNSLAKLRAAPALEPEDQFLLGRLPHLLRDFESFETDTVTDVRQRVRWAEHLAEIETRYQSRWQEAREAIQSADGVVASELYAEHPIDLQPQVGLVPIGPNPKTRLWEFYHLRSAWDPAANGPPDDWHIPEHHPETGHVTLADGSGMVFVLIPGGTLLMGAQRQDREAANYDPQAQADEGPVSSVEIAPFFLARHELTKGQWLRMAGKDPSWQKVGEVRDEGKPITPRHPIENVSWQDSTALLQGYGLRLPTEAQWEYGCRARQPGPWSTGNEALSLDGFANIADQSGGRIGYGPAESFDDGYQLLAPVGSFGASANGLFDVHGNVFEWTSDRYGSYDQPTAPHDGSRINAPSSDRVYRGGAFLRNAHMARLTHRLHLDPAGRYDWLGVRAARTLHK